MKDNVSNTHEHCGIHKHNWTRHTAMVPKGFIRFHVLNELNEQAMSGSELMEKLKIHTGGFWKPSPGSIYPLLSWLQENNYIAELPAENGLKRYQLTGNGKALLQEQKSVMKKFQEIMGTPKQPPFSNLFMKLSPEKSAQARETMKRIGTAMFKLGSVLQENLSEQAVDEAIQAVNEAAEKIEHISKKIANHKVKPNE